MDADQTPNMNVLFMRMGCRTVRAAVMNDASAAQHTLTAAATTHLKLKNFNSPIHPHALQPQDAL